MKIIETSAVMRDIAELPWNLTSPDEQDVVQIVLWYKSDSQVPIYRYRSTPMTGIKDVYSSVPNSWENCFTSNLSRGNMTKLG